MKKYLFLISLILTLLLPFISHAANIVTIFGPQTYERGTGKPVTEIDNFTINGLTGTGQITIKNGGGDKKTRVSSAEIWFNGNLIFSQNNFKKNVEQLVAEVSLAKNNEISFKLNGKPGSYLIAEVIKEDAAAAVISPEGGIFDFPNGVTLDIPPGAVNEKTVIKINNLPCEDVDEILAARDFYSHNKRCIGGFIANPNIIFNIPIIAILPIAPLESVEIPIPIKLDLDENKYWILETSLLYQDNPNMVEVEIQSFSGTGVVASKDRYEELCTDPYWLNKFGTDCVDKLKELTEVLCTDPSWNSLRPECEELDCLEPACCLLAEEDRPKPKNCNCCKELGGAFSLEEGDVTPLDECQLVGEVMNVFYPFCPFSPPESDCPNPQRREIGETSPGCPEDMTFQVKIMPENPQIQVCEEATLKAEITGFDKDGNALFTQEMPTTWRFDPPNTEVAEFTYLGPLGESKILGLKEGLVSVEAYSPDPEKFGTTLLEVMEPELNIIPADGNFRMNVGEEETWDALCLTCPDGEVVWDTDRPDVVELLELAGDAVRVKALSKGTALVRANFICGVPNPVVYTASVTVELEVGSLEIQPNTKTIAVNESLPLSIIVRDNNGNPMGGCPSTISWTIPPGGKIAFDIDTQTIRGVSPGSATITATCEGKSGSSRITVEEEAPSVGSVEIHPSSSAISVNDTLSLNVTIRDLNGINLGGCPGPISWEIPSGGIISFDIASQVVTGVSVGEPVTITATCEDKSGSATVTVQALPCYSAHYQGTLSVSYNCIAGIPAPCTNWFEMGPSGTYDIYAHVQHCPRDGWSSASMGLTGDIYYSFFQYTVDCVTYDQSRWYQDAASMHLGVSGSQLSGSTADSGSNYLFGWTIASFYGYFTEDNVSGTLVFDWWSPFTCSHSFDINLDLFLMEEW